MSADEADPPRPPPEPKPDATPEVAPEPLAKAEVPPPGPHDAPAEPAAPPQAVAAPPVAAVPVEPPPAPAGPAREVIYRHGLIVRLTHWINVLAISLLLMSGAQIFNAHPRLYWGQYGADADTPLMEMGALNSPHGLVGVTRVGGLTLTTTGVLGASREAGGQLAVRGFPRWLTLPSWRDLATGRRWHFFLAWVFVLNGLLYLLAGVLSGHFRRDLAPTGAQIRPRHILQSIWDHMRLKHPTGEEARHYNVLQKLTYLIVIFVLLPLMVGTGLTMSPGMDAVLPGLLTLFGGRQSARTIHFVSANLIVLFVLVHVVEVFLAGVWNEMRSMITGRYVVPAEAHR
ncbi:MAG TPA: cytochrome b/b6 domain-containing protein [Caulobacteraceae bacterium]|jgi:thiosulfate reductase cytochrome b subunit|nr:cytochrome b/b6 domain-containing protein [Caulobacteraceae bacterium]